MGKVIIITTTAVLFILTLHLALCNWFSGVTYELVVNPIELIGVVCSVAVTIYAARFITRKLASDRYRVEFLIKDMQIAHDELELIQAKVLHNDSILTGELYFDWNRLILVVARHERTMQDVANDMKLQDLDLKHLYHILTNNDGLNLELNDERRLKIIREIDDLLINIRKRIFNINKT